MSADLNTCISMQGTAEELLSMLHVLRVFETDNVAQYFCHHDCSYIEDVTISTSGGKCINLKDSADEELASFVSGRKKKLQIQADGPWGIFYELGDVGLFEALADSAPTARFIGSINGFVTGARVSLTADFRDGKLYLSEFTMPNEVLPQLYTEDVEKRLPLAKFCRIFKIDRDEFDSDDYEALIDEEGFPDDIDFDTFTDLCECSEIDEEQYDAAIEKVVALGIIDYDTFCDSIDEDRYSVKHVYDPVTKIYRKGSDASGCHGLTFVATGKLTSFKNREQLTEYIKSQGGAVTGSVSRNTNYLINNDAGSTSSKNKKASELGVKIITEDEFIQMFGRP